MKKNQISNPTTNFVIILAIISIMIFGAILLGEYFNKQQNVKFAIQPTTPAQEFFYAPNNRFRVHKMAGFEYEQDVQGIIVRKNAKKIEIDIRNDNSTSVNEFVTRFSAWSTAEIVNQEELLINNKNVVKATFKYRPPNVDIIYGYYYHLPDNSIVVVETQSKEMQPYLDFFIESVTQSL